MDRGCLLSFTSLGLISSWLGGLPINPVYAIWSSMVQERQDRTTK